MNLDTLVSFKFSIGDLVVPKAYLENIEDFLDTADTTYSGSKYKLKIRPTAYAIRIDRRIYEESNSGSQLFYTIKPIDIANRWYKYVDSKGPGNIWTDRVEEDEIVSLESFRVAFELFEANKNKDD